MLFTSILTWLLGLLAALSCLGLPLAVGLLTSLGAGFLADQHGIMIPLFEMLLVLSMLSAFILARRTHRQRLIPWIIGTGVLAGAGIFFHTALVVIGMGALLMLQLAMVVARDRAAPRRAGSMMRAAWS